MTNPQAAGLQRLLEDGTSDPSFLRLHGGVRSVVTEPGGTLLALIPVEPGTGRLRSPQRLDSNGAVITEFETTGFSIVGGESRWGLPDHRMVQLPDGSVVGHYSQVGASKSSNRHELIRWHPNGERDFNFEALIGTQSVGPRIQAVALLPDGVLLVSTRLFGTPNETPPPEEARRLVRIPPDSDSRLQALGLTNGEFRVLLATQPGRAYEVRRRSHVGAGDSTVVAVVQGDGYVQEISTPEEGDSLFLDYVRE